jgi:hypothetical protein
MEILVFGLANEDAMLRRLRKRFPYVGFKKCDAKHEIEDDGNGVTALDTVPGIDKVELLDDLGSLSPQRALCGSGTVMTLRILLRIGSIRSARVIGVPEGYPEEAAFEEISAIIKSL